ncbi:MAG: hypothetical protein WCI71_02150 [Bacteroidota bacterium]
MRIKYPEFLGNLSNEQATNEKLAISLSNVNQQYVEKIRLANSEEKLKDLAEVQEKASRKLSNAEQDRNVILSRSMELLYQANSMAAKLVEQAPTLDAKIELVKKYFGSIGGTGEAFLAAAQKAKAASLRMTEARQEFMDESLKIAEDGVRSSLNLTNTLDGVSNQILNVALRTKDETLKAIIQAEIADRESQQRIIANKLKSEKEKLDLTKLTEAQLNEIISRAREDSATNIDRTNSRLAQKELNRREGLANAYEQYMDLMREIADLEKTNFADKLSQTEQEIRAVNDKYNNEIKKIEEFKRHNKATLTPEKTKSLDTETGKLEIERDKQTKQILEQAEVSFADKVKLIHENLRVARMTITNREVYEINKKYDELQKEILDAIEYRYRQEISQANGNKDKIIEAEKNKAAAIVEIQAGVSDLNKARKEETDKAIKDGDIRFEEDLKGLKLKSDTELAKGKEKIQLELNQKYKKLLDENIGDEKRAKEIKAQMDSEQAAQENALATEKFKKMLSDAIQVAQAIVSSLSNVASAWEGYQNAILQQEAAADEQKKSSLKKQLDDKIISQQQYDTAVGKIDAEADKKKRKIAHDQAVVGKATAVANAIINTAVAITSVLSIPILGELLAVVVGVLGAAQVALILATPIPEAAKVRYAAIKARQAARGRYNVTGQDDGKLFRDVPYEQSFTGIPGRPLLVNETGDEIVIDPETTKKIQKESPWIFDEIQRARVVQHADGKYDVIGQDDGKTYKDVPFKGKPQTGVYSKPALISEEGQELIIDAETTKKIQRESPWIIDEIQRARVVQHADGNDPDWLYPSQQKRFTPALKSEKGPEPIVNVPTVINMQLNYPKLMQAINYSRVPQYAFGKDQQPTSTPSTSEPVIVRPVIVDKEFTDAIKTFNENAKKGFKSVIVYDDIWKESDKINRIQNDASSNR